MDLFKVLHVLVLFCVINQGLAWWGRGSRNKPSSRSSIKTNGGSSNGSGSNRRGSSWWSGRRRNRPSRRPSTQPKAKPKPPARKPKPKPISKSKGSSGWWSDTNRNFPWIPKPKQNPVPKPPWKPEHVVKSKQTTKPETDMKKVIEGYEGIEKKAYDAQPKNPKVHDTTIGIGFNLNRPDAEKTFKKNVPGVDFNKVKSGKQTITDEQARALFNHDVDNIYEPRARNKVGKDVYDKLPSNVKAAIVNAVFRGDLGPKTTKLIKQRKWKEVGKEYLDHEQYKNADALGIPGVKTRMKWNKEQFDTMIKQ